jgi:hypothetical protein
VPKQPRWLDAPEDHDYPAALDYLELVGGGRDLTQRMKRAETTRKKAKDILRASRLPLLPKDNPHVAADLRKIRRGERLSPVLLVRGDWTQDLPLTIADGYHRVCAAYHVDENSQMPCRLV